MPSSFGIWRWDESSERRVAGGEERVGDRVLQSLFAIRCFSLLRLRRRVALGIDAQPAGGRQTLLRQIAALVVHLLRAFDPVAEIDVGQALAPGPRDVVQDHEGAERARGL